MRKISLPLIAILAMLSASCVTAARNQELCDEYFAMAEGYAGISKYDKALDYYRKAVKSRQLENASQYGIGRMHALLGNWDEAIAAFSPLYAKDPENSIVTFAYAYSLAAGGKADRAVELYAKLYETDRENLKFARDYAEILVIAGRYQEGLDQIGVLKEKFPDTDAVKDIDALEKKANDGLNPPPPEKKEDVPSTDKKEETPPAEDTKETPPTEKPVPEKK